MQPNVEMSYGQATFDLKAARKHADADGLMGTTKWLYAACDEIERHAGRIVELEAAYLKAQNSNLLRKQAYESLEKVASEQSKRIAELESTNEQLRAEGKL